MIKKKILIIIPSLEEGGAERVLVNLLNKLDYERLEVDLCVVEKRGIYFNEVPQDVRVITIFNNELICKIFNGLHVKYNLNCLYKWYANRVVRSNYDIGISFLDSSFTDILFFLNKKIEKKIAWVHSSYQTYINFKKFFTNRYKERLIRKRYSQLDTIIFVSEDSKKEFRTIFGDFHSMEVIYNLIDADAVINKSKELIAEHFDKDVVNIIALGVLLPVKGYDRLIRAAQMLKQENLRFKIRILGNGYLEKELQELIKQLEVEDFVELKGFHYNPYPFLRLSQIFVMTSLSEGLPTALCEAMILGLPSVVTDCSGCRELVGYGEYGVMTEQSAESIFQGLKDLITKKDQQIYYKKKSLERAEIFNDNAILEKIYQVIAI